MSICISLVTSGHKLFRTAKVVVATQLPGQNSFANLLPLFLCNAYASKNGCQRSTLVLFFDVHNSDFSASVFDSDVSLMDSSEEEIMDIGIVVEDDEVGVLSNGTNSGQQSE